MKVVITASEMIDCSRCNDKLCMLFSGQRRCVPDLSGEGIYMKMEIDARVAQYQVGLVDKV